MYGIPGEFALYKSNFNVYVCNMCVRVCAGVCVRTCVLMGRIQQF